MWKKIHKRMGRERRYIGRYLARPAIAEYKILSHDGENVTFWYKSHETNKRVVSGGTNTVM